MKLFLTGAIVLAFASFVSPAQQPPAIRTPRVTEVFVRDTISSLNGLIANQYFDTAAIPRIQEALIGAEQHGDYAKAGDLQQLASDLNAALSAASHDKHLFVSVTALPGSDAAALSLSRSERARLDNFGLKRAEILDGNVGYLDITAFYRADEGAATLQAAMKFVSHTDALILDLRKNGGGSPDTAIQLLSYFFTNPDLPLFSETPRFGKPTVYMTESQGVSNRYGTRPVYVLVSGSTWSAGEAVPFILQERQRATIIGEKTAGAANPAQPWPINDLLSVTIPVGRIETEVRKTNWEGRGVVPDVTASPSHALKVAYVDALSKLRDSAQTSARRDVISKALAAAEASKIPGNYTP